MKNTFKRLLTLFLAGLMILPVLVACGSGNDSDGPTVNPDAETINLDSEDNPKLEPIDYGGYEFTFLTNEGAAYNTYYLVADEENAEEPLPVALTKRNQILEEKYNITITQFKSTDILSTVRAQVMSGTTDFDVILASCARLATMAQENLLYDLKSVPQFDLSKPYWDQNANAELLIGDKLYFTNNTINIHTIGFVVYFNKKLISDYGLTSPYELIDNNEWTVDNWATMVKSISKDMDGDGRMTELDQYGTMSENHNPRMFLYAFGIRATTNNAEGYPEVTLMADKDKTVTAYEKLKAVFSDNTVCYNLTTSSVDPHGFATKYGYLRSLFMQDLYLFHYTGDGQVKSYADMESEFGIIPFPKYDSNQKEFKTMYQYNCNLFALPSVIEDVDRTGRIVEDMCFYSEQITVPTWFDTLLARRYTRDEESRKYLYVLRDNCVYDVGMYYDFGNIRSEVLDVDISTNEILRNYTRHEKAIKIGIERTYEKFKNN